MKVIVITQEDSFYLPRCVERIALSGECDVALVVSVSCDNSLSRRKLYFARGYGVAQGFRMARRLLGYRAANALDSLMGYRCLTQKRSIKAVSASRGIPYCRTSDPNDELTMSKIADVRPELIVSLSAPRKFSKKLMGIPRKGCINMHCSMLPKYAGIMPSFWMLHKKESMAGATIHYMNEEIDGGDVILQDCRSIDKGTSVFELIGHTKELGTGLLLEAIRRIANGNIERVKMSSDGASFYSWPTLNQMLEFRKQGGRYI